jgi:hypothetical protein
MTTTCISHFLKAQSLAASDARRACVRALARPQAVAVQNMHDKVIAPAISRTKVKPNSARGAWHCSQNCSTPCSAGVKGRRTDRFVGQFALRLVVQKRARCAQGNHPIDSEGIGYGQITYETAGGGPRFGGKTEQRSKSAPPDRSQKARNVRKTECCRDL